MDAAKARRSLRNGFITLILAGALVVGLLLAVPGLKGVATTVSHMKPQWVVAAILLEVLSCASYVLVFLQVCSRAPFRVGARLALSEEAFGAAVALGGVGSLAVGGWLMVERGAPAGRIAERSAVLFLYTSAINAFTLILAGLGLFLGLPGPSNPLLSIVPAAVGAGVLALFMLLPRYVDRIVRRVRPGRLHTFLTETAVSVRDTERLMFHPDWRILGAIGYLWFDIAVLFACFAAAGHVPPLAPVVLAYQIGYLSNFIPVPGGIGVLDGSLIGTLVIYGVGGTVATAATLVYHAISLWVPAVWGNVAFVLRPARGARLLRRRCARPEPADLWRRRRDRIVAFAIVRRAFARERKRSLRRLARRDRLPRNAMARSAEAGRSLRAGGVGRGRREAIARRMPPASSGSASASPG